MESSFPLSSPPKKAGAIVAVVILNTCIEGIQQRKETKAVVPNWKAAGGGSAGYETSYQRRVLVSVPFVGVWRKPVCLLRILLVNICRAHALVIEPINLVVRYKEIS